MRWDDERYVRVYTRDTVNWKMLPWQARCVLALLFRKVDRAGLLDLDDHGAEGLAAILELPIDIVEPGLAALVRKGSIFIASSGTLLVPKFLEAQEAQASDAQRKRDQRERAAARARFDEVAPEISSHSVTDSHATGQTVTPSHTESLAVTGGHSDPCLAVPSCSDFPSGAKAIASPPEQSSFKLAAPEQPTSSTPSAPDVADAIMHYQRRWVEVRQPDDGIPPKLQKADRGQLISMLKAYGPDGWRRHLERYLADCDRLVADNGWPLRLMSGRVDGYRAMATPRAKNGPLPPMAAATESKTELM